MTHLAEMTSLQRLNLQDVGFRRDGVSLTSKGVTQLSSLENLEWLNLRGTDIGDDGVLALGALPKLASLDVAACYNVTSKGIAKLRAVRPEIQVRR